MVEPSASQTSTKADYTVRILGTQIYLLSSANLTGADLSGANLAGAYLTEVTNLTQQQLDTACGKRELPQPEPRQT